MCVCVCECAGVAGLPASPRESAPASLDLSPPSFFRFPSDDFQHTPSLSSCRLCRRLDRLRPHGRHKLRVQPRRLLRFRPVHQVHGHPAPGQQGHPAPAHQGVWVARAHHHPGHARGQQGARAGRGAPVVGARLKGDVGGAAGGGLAFWERGEGEGEGVSGARECVCVCGLGGRFWFFSLPTPPASLTSGPQGKYLGVRLAGLGVVALADDLKNGWSER